MPASLGAPEILVILVVALIVLGPKRLPEAGRQIGRAMSEVRRWSQSVQSEIKDVIDVNPDVSPPTYPSPPPPAPAPVSSAEPSASDPAPGSKGTGSPAASANGSAEPSGDATAPGTPPTG